MVFFVLNETKEKDHPGEMIAFTTLKAVSLYIEPIDVDNGEYSLFDTDGRFYEISTTGDFDRFIYTEIFQDFGLAQKLVDGFLGRVNRTAFTGLSLEEKAKRISSSEDP